MKRHVTVALTNTSISPKSGDKVTIETVAAILDDHQTEGRISDPANTSPCGSTL